MFSLARVSSRHPELVPGRVYVCGVLCVCVGWLGGRWDGMRDQSAAPFPFDYSVGQRGSFDAASRSSWASQTHDQEARSNGSPGASTTATATGPGSGSGRQQKWSRAQVAHMQLQVGVRFLSR